MRSIDEARGRWALVTGASRGIGREMALALAEQGVNVIVHSSNLDGTADLVPELQQRGVECFAVAADLTDPPQVKAMAQDVVDRVNIDLLFNNAGMNAWSWEHDGAIDTEAWLTTYLVNLVAPTILINEIMPGMVERGFGRIVNTTSGILDQPCAYAASKGALNKLTKDYAATLEGTGVTMNVLDPGWIRTDLGGPEAENDLSTVIPGTIVGGFLDDAVTGAWINAQDFVGMTLAEAVTAPSEVLRITVTG